MNIISSIWTYPIGLFKELKNWFLFRRVVKNEPEIIEDFKNHDPELRVDWLGRVYTVVNVPEELWPAEYSGSYQAYVVGQLSKINAVMIKHRLQDMVYPSTEPIQQEGVRANLIKLYPWSGEYFNFGSFFYWILKLAGIFVVVKALNSLMVFLTGSGILANITNLIS